MLRRVRKYIRDNGLLNDGDRVLVCVSGGADSVALLDVLQRAGYDCVVAHCNFHLRGEESNRDEQFVRQLVTDIPLHIQHFDTQSFAQTNRQSIELAARELRYRWFDALAEQEGCKAIAVAHHQNDQAETVVMNLKRGCGIRGLCGMRAKSKNAYIDNDIPIIRPLLCTTRDYIVHYLKDIRHLQWVEDSTNSDTDFKRNAVREELKNYTKSEIEHIASTAEHMQGYVDWLENEDTQAAGKVKLYEELKEYGFTEIGKMYDAQQSGVGGKTFYSADYKAVLKRGKYIVERLDKKRYGIIGNPLGHSYSEQYFMAKFAEEGVKASYQAFQLMMIEDAKSLIKDLNGFNVTYPFKETIIHYLKELDGTAQAIGAVNVVHQGKGYNTDWLGFRDSITPLLTERDQRALLLGTGGVSKAIAYALQQMGVKFTFVSRTPHAGELGYHQLTEEVMSAHTIVINCTPLGMHPYESEMPDIPYCYLGKEHLLFDCIYNPEITRFLSMGQAQGCRIKNGLEMLHIQADYAWKIWNMI